MENFVSPCARDLWNVFSKTGNVGVYMLYNAVQTGKYANLYIDNSYTNDGGMEL